MTTKKSIKIDIPADKMDQLEKQAIQKKSSIEEMASYAVQLGLKLIESGLDSDSLIRALQEPGEGLDIHLMMAKKKSRKDLQRIQDTAMYRVGQRKRIDWSKNKIPPEAYTIDDYDFDRIKPR